MGLVQIFHAASCPDLLARHLLKLVLADFRGTGRCYLLHLLESRKRAWDDGAAEDEERLDGEIREHLVFEDIPRRWHLTSLFSQACFATFGTNIFAAWAAVLIHLCILEQHWEETLLGLAPKNPYLLSGFHAESEVYSDGWLEDFRRLWRTELPDVCREPGECRN